MPFICTYIILFYVSYFFHFMKNINSIINIHKKKIFSIFVHQDIDKNILASNYNKFMKLLKKSTSNA